MNNSKFKSLVPDMVEIIGDHGKKTCRNPQQTLIFDDIIFVLDAQPSSLGIKIRTESTAVSFIKLRWQSSYSGQALVCPDAWERTYGDTCWQRPDPAKIMPWYFALFDQNQLICHGVKVRPGAFAGWICDPAGVTLWLDVRCGARPLALHGRELDAATVVTMHRYLETPAVSDLRDFCKIMCDDPLLADHPVYGSNNWYYAYGQSSRGQLLQDAKLLAELTAGLTNRPYLVIDDGWQTDRDNAYNGGPWRGSHPDYGDFKQLAAEIKAHDLRPGIWFRPLFDRSAPNSWRSHRDASYLDPSLPEILEHVRTDVKYLVDNGYELIKHDFSTFDIFGAWGFEMRGFPATGDWTFGRQDKTSAEIIIDLYRAILDGAGDAIILGCNTIGHLGAGLMHLSRTGDDTSGRNWERTRKMGINTLAFRLAQHRVFFDADPDCVGITGQIDWRFNSRWAQLAAESGTSFFASIQPEVLTSEQKKQMSEYFAIASAGRSNAEPLDWLTTNCPQTWRIDNSAITFDWYGADGVTPEFIQ